MVWGYSPYVPFAKRVGLSATLIWQKADSASDWCYELRCRAAQQQILNWGDGLAWCRALHHDVSRKGDVVQGDNPMSILRKPLDERFDDGAVFHYCTVILPNVRHTYPYLTGDLPIKVGDWVEVPFGKEDLPRRGQIGSVTDCIRQTAPWPPEQNKTVLRILEAPPASEEKPV